MSNNCNTGISIPTLLPTEPCDGNYISTNCVASPNANSELDLPIGATQTQTNAAITAALLHKEEQIQSIITDISNILPATLHNDLGGLNVGDYQHLTVAEKSTIFDPKTIKIAFLGDSITAGSGSTGGATSYADILNNLFSFQTYTKLGVSSATAKPTTPRPQLSSQVSAIPVGTNFITVMIGINDWSENTVIGDVNAVLAKSYGTLDQNLSFSEAFRYNMETIKNNFPNAQIRVILPIKHGSGWVRDLDFKFYVDAEIQIANFLSIPVINAYDASLLAKDSPYVPDGIHPNDIGYNMLSEVVKKGIIDNKTTKQDNSFYNLLVGSSVKNGSTDVVQITGGGSTTGRFSIGSLYTSGRFTQITPSIIGGTPNIQAYLQGTGTDRLSLQGLGGNLLIGSLSDNGSGDKLQINGGISSSSRFSIGGFSAGGRFMQFTPSLTSDAPNIQGYNTGFGQDYISLQGLGGKLFIGSIFDNGSGADVQINGSIYTTAPTTSAGGYDILTRNTSTGKVEKVASSGVASTISPTFTGTPTAPTATVGTNTTQIATTAFVTSAVTSGTYTPTLTNTTNITSNSLNQATYNKIGDIVTVTIGILIDVTTSVTNSKLTISLPFNTSITTASGSGVGNITSTGASLNAAGILNIVSASTAEFVFYPSGNGSAQCAIQFQYKL